MYDSISIGGFWPAGFQSLRQISICNSTSLQHPHDAYYVNASCIAPLFLLPNIKVLNLTLLGYTDDDDPDFLLPPKCSSVEELAFSCCDLTLQAHVKFIQACKSLRSYLSAASSLRDDGNDELVRVLARCHGTTLENLSLSCSGYHKRYRSWLSTLATRFPNLKSLEHLKLRDLLRDPSTESHSDVAELEFRPPYPARRQTRQRAQDPNFVQVVELRGILPTGIENLHVDFQGGYGSTGLEIMPNAVLLALADLVEDERFGNIKVLCLHSLRCSRGEQVKLDQEALHRIKARGIDTHEEADASRPAYVHHMKQHRDGNQGLAENETDPRRARRTS